MQRSQTHTTHPSKEAVRLLMQQRRQEHTPPPTPERIRAALDWRLLPS
jgi:hypothetical protein